MKYCCGCGISTNAVKFKGMYCDNCEAKGFSVLDMCDIETAKARYKELMIKFGGVEFVVRYCKECGVVEISGGRLYCEVCYVVVRKRKARERYRIRKWR